MLQYVLMVHSMDSQWKRELVNLVTLSPDDLMTGQCVWVLRGGGVMYGEVDKFLCLVFLMQFGMPPMSKCSWFSLISGDKSIIDLCLIVVLHRWCFFTCTNKVYILILPLQRYSKWSNLLANYFFTKCSNPWLSTAWKLLFYIHHGGIWGSAQSTLEKKERREREKRKEGGKRKGREGKGRGEAGRKEGTKIDQNIEKESWDSIIF